MCYKQKCKVVSLNLAHPVHPSIIHDVLASSHVGQRDHVRVVAEREDSVERLEQTDRDARRPMGHGNQAVAPCLLLTCLLNLEFINFVL